MSDDRRDADRENMVSLRHYCESLFTMYTKNHEHTHVLIAQTVEATRESMEKRLSEMNNLRAQVLEERGGLATKEWVLALVSKTDASIYSMEKGLLKLETIESIATKANISASLAKEASDKALTQSRRSTLVSILGPAAAVIAALIALLKP